MTFSEQVEAFSALLSTQFILRDEDIRQAHLVAIDAAECKQCGCLDTRAHIKEHGICRLCLEEDQINECEEVERMEQAVEYEHGKYLDSFGEER